MGDFFDVITRKQSYLNIVYLLVSFPLSIGYFVFFVTGLSLGIGLTPILVGIPILLLTFIGVRLVMFFECLVAEKLLCIDSNIRNAWAINKRSDNEKILHRARDTFFDPQNWKAALYIFFKFIYNNAAFTISVAFISTSAALVFAPFIYQMFSPQVTIDINGHSLLYYLGINLPVFDELLVYMFIGLLLSVVTMHLLNMLAYVSGRILCITSQDGSSRPENLKLRTIK